MNVKQFLNIIFDMMKYNNDEDRKEESVVFQPEDSDCRFIVTEVHKGYGGGVVLESDTSKHAAMDLWQIQRQLSKFDRDEELQFFVYDHGSCIYYEITDDWDVDDEDFVVTIDGEEEIIDENDFLEDGGDTATVRQLAEAMHEYGDARAHLFATDSSVIERASVDSIYPRDGKVMLQSNQIELESVDGDPHAYSLTLAYIMHCLKFFNPDTDVLFMHCDDDNDSQIFNVTGYHIEKGKLFLDIDEQ